MSVLAAAFTSSGGLAALTADDLSLLQYPATELETGPCGLWLRTRHDGVRAHRPRLPATDERGELAQAQCALPLDTVDDIGDQRSP